jgi:NAD(P)-dependent dehydrogenase (short-subunit alcohol dehydrogenase family)
MHAAAAAAVQDDGPACPAAMTADDHAAAQGRRQHHSKGDSSSSSSSSSRRRLEGKVAIVTGGARGVGEAIARTFVRHGARVVIADDIDDAAGEALAAALACTYERCDVSVEADVERTVRLAVARHGQLDVMLCNNAAAGVLGRRQAESILSLDAAEFERVLRVNALGAALGVKHAAAAMLRTGGGGGSIVSVASVMGGMGPHAHTASKHALVGLTKNAACELGRHGIRVNCISPAWQEAGDGDGDDDAVERMVLGRLGNLKGVTPRASDIAEAALFLASDDSTFVSGHNLVVGGGGGGGGVTTTCNNVVGL